MTRSKQRTKRTKIHGGVGGYVSGNKINVHKNECASSKNLKRKNISSNAGELDNDFNLNMITNCEILKNVFEYLQNAKFAEVVFGIDITK